MFENSNKIQKVILSISFIIALPIIFIGFVSIVENGNWMVPIIALAILAGITYVFYKLWASNKNIGHHESNDKSQENSYDSSEKEWEVPIFLKKKSK